MSPVVAPHECDLPKRLKNDRRATCEGCGQRYIATIARGRGGRGAGWLWNRFGPSPTWSVGEERAS